jgi:integrase/recombinase XerD
VHVAAYVEQLGKTHSAPSVKQHLAAVRMLFDWLVVGQVVAGNPASVVRGPNTSRLRFQMDTRPSSPQAGSPRKR